MSDRYRGVRLEPEGSVKEPYREQSGCGTYQLFILVHVQYYSPTVVLRYSNIALEAETSTRRGVIDDEERGTYVTFVQTKSTFLIFPL